MTALLGISGSLRQGSYNTLLLQAAAAFVPPGVTLEFASIRGVPLYDGDVEASSGVPESVAELKQRIRAADGLLLVTPEYNNSIPGTFKNTIDWLSRPAAEIPALFGQRPVAVMGATPGPGGTLLAQAAWLPVLRTLGTLPWFGARVAVSGAGQVFDSAGQITDERVRAQLARFMAGFSEFVKRMAVG